MTIETFQRSDGVVIASHNATKKCRIYSVGKSESEAVSKLKSFLTNGASADALEQTLITGTGEGKEIKSYPRP